MKRMSRARRAFHSLLVRVDGQDLVEYAMLAALIAIVATTAVATLGNTINNVLWTFIVASF
jgi:Flp pilus assembly pilin Flp